MLKQCYRCTFLLYGKQAGFFFTMLANSAGFRTRCLIGAGKENMACVVHYLARGGRGSGVGVSKINLCVLRLLCEAWHGIRDVYDVSVVLV